MYVSTCRSVGCPLGDCCAGELLPWTELWGSSTIQTAKLHSQVLLFPSAMVRWLSLLLGFWGVSSRDSDG